MMITEGYKRKFLSNTNWTSMRKSCKSRSAREPTGVKSVIVATGLNFMVSAGEKWSVVNKRTINFLDSEKGL